MVVALIMNADVQLISETENKPELIYCFFLKTTKNNHDSVGISYWIIFLFYFIDYFF